MVEEIAPHTLYNRVLNSKEPLKPLRGSAAHGHAAIFNNVSY